jgi:hypothetical protein
MLFNFFVFCTISFSSFCLITKKRGSAVKTNILIIVQNYLPFLKLSNIFEVLTAVIMVTFWIVTPCGLVDTNVTEKNTFFHLQG